MNYILAISRKFPTLQVSVSGPLNDYASLIAEEGSVLPSQAELETAYLECVKEDKWEAIKAERDRRKAAGVKVGTYWFHSDDASRIQQIALTMLGPNIPANLQWKTMTGQFTTMTQTLAAQVFQTSIQSDQIIFGRAEIHRANMMASADPGSYDFSGGWPTTYADSPEAAEYASSAPTA
jgi:hypothetical protein